MRITKVYTRTGDAGKTRLAGGQPVYVRVWAAVVPSVLRSLQETVITAALFWLPPEG